MCGTKKTAGKIVEGLDFTGGAVLTALGRLVLCREAREKAEWV